MISSIIMEVYKRLLGKYTKDYYGSIQKIYFAKSPVDLPSFYFDSLLRHLYSLPNFPQVFIGNTGNVKSFLPSPSSP